MTWWRDEWATAIWEASGLPANARLVALCYAAHAGQDAVVFVHGARLRARTNLSRDAVNRALRQLEGDGWLAVQERSRQHYSTRYRMVIPAQHYASRTAETVDSQGSVPPAVPLDRSSVPSPDTSVPFKRTSVPRGGNESTSLAHSLTSAARSPQEAQRCAICNGNRWINETDDSAGTKCPRCQGTGQEKRPA